MRPSNGAVVAWGNNWFGQVNVPVSLSNVVGIAGGGYHSLALKSDHTVIAWGDNGYGQTNVPAGLSNVITIATGFFHNLALKSDGTVAAWGDNSYGQTNVPLGLTNVVAIAAGGTTLSDFGEPTSATSGHSRALNSDGTVVAWGAGMTNWGPMPYAFGQSKVPVGLSNVVAIAAAFPYSLALTARLSISSLVLDGQNPTIRFHTFSGQHYVVEVSPDLNPSHWVPLPGGDVSGNGNDAVVTDTNGVTMASRFYRVSPSSSVPEAKGQIYWGF